MIGEFTAVMPALAGYAPAMPVAQPSTRRLRSIPLVFIALIILVLIGLAVMLTRNDPSGGLGANVNTVVTTVPVTEPVPTEPPATAVPPTPLPVPVIGEIIPGFPRTDDLQVFLQQLQANPALVGPAGTQLTESLGELLAEKANKQQRERASELSDQIEEWVDDGQLDPSISQSLLELLAPLNRNGNDD